MASGAAGHRRRRQWPAIWKADLAKDHPNVVMILAGRWEVSNRTYDGHWTNIENPTLRRVRQTRAHAGGRRGRFGGATVVLMTAPCYDTGEQPDGQPWPEDSAARLAIYNEIVRQVAASTPGTSLLDFNAMACPGGQYEEYMDGQQVRLADGIHFTLHRRQCLCRRRSGPSLPGSVVSRWLNPASSPSPASLRWARAGSRTTKSEGRDGIHEAFECQRVQGLESEIIGRLRSHGFRDDHRRRVRRPDQASGQVDVGSVDVTEHGQHMACRQADSLRGKRSRGEFLDQGLRDARRFDQLFGTIW